MKAKKILFFATSMLLFQNGIYGARPSKQAEKKHFNAILEKTLKHTDEELKNISKLNLIKILISLSL